MTSRRTNSEEIAECVTQCKQRKITLLPFDINKSDEIYRVENNAIRFSINTIKGVGDNALISINSILPVYSFDDFIRRCDACVIDKTVFTALIKAGAFDSFEKNRYKLLYQYFSTRKLKADRLLAEEYKALINKFNDKVIMKMEKEVLGFYLTKSPFDAFSFKSLTSFSADKYACIGGEIIKIKAFNDKNGNKMAFVGLATEHGIVDVVIFAKQYAQFENDLVVGNIVMIEGSKENDTKIKTNKITQIA